MTFSFELLILYFISVVICLYGFKRLVYFISVCYGFSMAAIAIASAIIFRGGLDIWTVLACTVMAAAGIRLGGFIIWRMLRSKSYNKSLNEQTESSDKAGFGVKILMLLSCPVLYVAMAAPLFYRLANGAASDLWLIVGIAVSAFGLVFEVIADNQKSAAKKVNPRRFVSSGLYRIVRCPNYLGEMLIWTGFFVSGFGATMTWGQWIISTAGYICIIWVMFSGARRLEIRQNRNYGSDPEYQEYVRKTPILLPCIPLYSVEKYKWLVG